MAAFFFEGIDPNTQQEDFRVTVDDINKADGDNERKAERARVEYSNALHLFPASPDGWVPPVVTMSSLTGKGIHNSGRRFSSIAPNLS